MSSTAIAEPRRQEVIDEYDRETAELMGLAEEKPTLQMINSAEIKPIEEWEELYPELWLFIEVTREDVHYIHEGKLIATAENTIEFLDLGRAYRQRQIVYYKTRGGSLSPQPIVIPILAISDTA